MNIREITENLEMQTLSPFAKKSSETLGRLEKTEKCELRTEFQRDRDRILHCKTFRRLMHKTQVFLNPVGDHYRTRLTHTLEVSQIARTIARALRLNEDLTEAIALGHDLGHTPFGHAGERILKEVYDKNFTHYAQSLRVVDKLEKLNLTYEVRDGIFCHTKGGASTLEGKVILWADQIAFTCHDIDDAIRGGIIDALPQFYTFDAGETSSERIDYFVKALIKESADKNDIGFDDKTLEVFNSLKTYMSDYVYTNPKAKSEEGKAEQMLAALYEYYLNHPEELHDEYKEIAENEGIARAVCDYISGMTDRYATNCYNEHFVPKVWNG